MNQRRSFLKQAGLLTISMGLMPDLAFSKSGSGLPRSNPEAQGVASEDILRYFDAIEKSGQEFHATMILKNGHVIAESCWDPYGPDHKLELYSLSKSFTSTAIGFAEQEGLLSVEDQVIKYFPGDLPDIISENLKLLKIKHLLMMGVGQAKDSIQTLERSPEGTTWARTFLALPMEFEPGTRFFYNSGASFMLSAIVQKVSGVTIHEFLHPRLFKPLGMTNTDWSRNPEGINFGASHLRITIEDFAKFGQFYLQKGTWEGKRLLNEKYIEEASSKQIITGKNTNSWGYGYGYQFWLNPPGGFRADGAYGQYSMIFPDINAVVAISSESMDKEATMHLVWDILYPALKKNDKLPSNKSGKKELDSITHSRRLNPGQLVSQSPLEKSIQAKTYIFEKNDLGIKSIRFGFSDRQVNFVVDEEGFEPYTISCGRNTWVKAKNHKPGAHSLFSRRRIDYESKVAAAAGWENGNTLQISLRLLETCHSDYLTCVFDGNKLVIGLLFSVQKKEGKADGRDSLLAYHS